LPLDVRAAAEELLGHLRDWQRKAGERFDLSPAVARAEEVVSLANQLQQQIQTAKETLETDEIKQINEVVSRVESMMVRLNYTRSDPFDHDPALSQPPVPLLAPVDRLVAADAGSDEENEVLTLLVRRRNRVLHELSEARRTLRDGAGILSGAGV
jgi:hypothetical protein